MDEASGEALWRALAEKAVAGCFDALRSATDEGIAIEPLYPRSRVEGPRPWRKNEAWSVSQRVDHPDAAIANRTALLDLEGGADALTVVFTDNAFGRGFGLTADASEVDSALEGVELDLISLRIDAGSDAVAIAAMFADLAERRRLASAGLTVDLGYDPIGLSARTGRPLEIAQLRSVLDSAVRGGLSGCPMLADGRIYHEAGAGEAQELAAVLATGVGYLRHLEASGLDLAAARDSIAVLLAADADVFTAIAKMRAIRRLWARVETACGLVSKPLRLHAETSWRIMSRYDPWVNTMRATAAVAAAALGGADTITVLPMSLPLGLPDDAARRLARNVGRVLLDEANLAKVDDPAAGSGGLDALTDGLCSRAWNLFRDIERAGGIEAALRAGNVQCAIAATAEKRRGAMSTLTRGLVGTSRFPSLLASDVRVLDVPPRRPVASSGLLPSMRDAEPFEALRDRAEARAAQGRRPSIVLATLGSPADFGARADDATNIFAAAGIAVADRVDAAEVGALAGRTRVACLCGTESAYAAQGGAAIIALREAGATYVLMAGADPSWLTHGVDGLVHAGADVLRVLGSTLDLVLRPE